MRITVLTACAALLFTSLAVGQSQRPSSPRGQAATELGGSWSDDDQRPSYEDGKWIVIDYGRPILRQREAIFGSGEAFGEAVTAGAPVWRTGANQSTRLVTEADLKIGDTVVPAGEYSVFIDLQSPTEWTFILSDWGAQDRYDPEDKDSLWGSYGYTPEKDVVRAAMEVVEIPIRVDQLSFGFYDVTKTGGNLALWWDNYQASVPFSLAD